MDTSVAKQQHFDLQAKIAFRLKSWHAGMHPPPRTHVHTHTHERATHTHTENKPVLCSNSSPVSGFPQGYRYKQEETGRHSFPWLVGWAGLLADAILDYAGR